jgi:hypothetical protein
MRSSRARTLVVTWPGNATGSPPVAQPRNLRVAQPTAQHRSTVAAFISVFGFAFGGFAFGVAFALAGCAATVEAVNADVNADGANPDGRPPPPHCVSRLGCDGAQVRVCDRGVLGQVVENCGADQTCSEGRCTSTACAAVERKATASGCLFYGALVDNTDRDDRLASTVIVTNQSDENASANLQLRDDGHTWRTIQSLHLAPADADRFAIPGVHLEGGGVGPGLGFRIVADRPLTAALIESDDSTEMSESTGGTMLLPHHALGNEYLVMMYPQQPMAALSATPGSRNGAGQVTVVATGDRTQVTVKLTQGATLDTGGGIPQTAPGEKFAVTLDDGDILQFFSHDDDTDLSGTSISADQPVAVLSGNVFTSYGLSGPGINSPDMALEQMLPVRSWSQTYVAARLGPQQGTCDSVFGGNAALWRVGAAADDTHVSFEGPPGVDSGLPQGEMILAAGEVRQFLVPTADSFLINGSKPIVAMQGMDCEATLSSGVATDSAWHDLRLALPANFDHELLVVRREGVPVALDGKTIADSLFTGAGGPFQVARVAVPPCVDRSPGCLHVLKGTFGLTLRGMDVLCGYALTVPTWPSCGLFSGPDF